MEIMYKKFSIWKIAKSDPLLWGTTFGPPGKKYCVKGDSNPNDKYVLSERAK